MPHETNVVCSGTAVFFVNRPPRGPSMIDFHTPVGGWSRLWFHLYTALFSAALIFFSSSMSLARLSHWCSATVAQPPDDLSANWISLFLSLISFKISSNFRRSLLVAFSFIKFFASEIWCWMSLNSNCFLLDLYLNSSRLRFRLLLEEEGSFY